MTEDAAAVEPPPPPVRVAVPAEVTAGERRVALVPRTVSQLHGFGLTVMVERGAGAGAHIADDAYAEAGADIVADAAELFGGADIVLKVRCPAQRADGRHEADLVRSGCAVVGMLDPTANEPVMERLAHQGASVFSLERMPRITRAQEMDVLSSMGTVSGYHAVLRAAVRLPRFFPLLMTAAGTVKPARVLVLGAGVAGLTAIATAHRLGASVEAYDIRAAAREDVESLGARFVDISIEGDTQDAGGYARALSDEAAERQRQVLTRHVADADVVVTTALVPGKTAPLLVTGAMVAAMRPGSVIVDLAAEAGGNCELTEPGREVVVGGVLIDGPLGIPSMMAIDASQLYSRNIGHFARMLTTSGALRIDLNDVIVRATCVAHAGRRLHNGEDVSGGEAVA